jgi:hypothetical protein
MFDFETGAQGWTFAGTINPFDTPGTLIANGSLALSPNGSMNCFSFWQSPDVTIEDAKFYRVLFEVGSTTALADLTVQFRLRCNQKESWQAWHRIVNSNLQNAPSFAATKNYSIYLDPNVTGAGDNLGVLSFDIISFDINDDISSWLFLDSAAVYEATVSP